MSVRWFHKTPLLNPHWREIKSSPLSGIVKEGKTQRIFSGLSKMCARVFHANQNCPVAGSRWQVGTRPPAWFSPSKATDISNSYRVQLHATESSITRSNLAGNLWSSHAGLAPNSSVNTAQRLTTKEDWLKFRRGGRLHTCSSSDIKTNLLFLSTGCVPYIPQSLWESLGAAEHRGNWMDCRYT